MNSKSGPDVMDWRILELLQRNARLSNSEIGRIVGLSQPAVTSRIQRLEDGGVIEGYAARINPRRVGREVTAVIRLRTTHAQLRGCLAALDAVPEVVDVCRLTGEDCLMIKGVFERMGHVESLIDTLAPFGSVTTSFVLAAYAGKPLTRGRERGADRDPIRARPMRAVRAAARRSQ